MASYTCAISGLNYEFQEFGKLRIPHSSGYIHPIFACSHKQLYGLLAEYAANKLTVKESYLLFLATLYHSELVEWESPCSVNLDTLQGKQAVSSLVANNISSLFSAIEQTNVIRHPRFEQPSYKVTVYNCNLDTIGNWITSLKENINSFH